METRAALAFLAAAAVALSGCFGAPPNTPPVVTAKASATSVAVGDEVVFTGTAVDLDGSVSNFAWDFESDGNIDFLNTTRGTAAHRFPLPGMYTASFFADDDKGLRATAAVNVSVVARFAFNADWGAETAFVVHGAATLSAASVVVTVSPTGAPAPFVFRAGEGLTTLNNTSYRVALQGFQLDRYASIRVEATYNGTPSGFRVFSPVPYETADNDPTVVYTANLEDLRNLGDANSTLTAVGRLTVLASPSVAIHRFEGSATSVVRAAQRGVFENATYSLATLHFNHTITAATAAFVEEDYAWSGTGHITSESPGGAPVAIDYSTFTGARSLGNATFVRTQGTGSFGTISTPTYGDVTIWSEGTTSSIVMDGEGIARLALRVVEDRTYDGLLLGAAYHETNTTMTLHAASALVMNTAIYEAWNSTFTAGTTNQSSTGSRFLDTDGDGRFNPDPRPTLPFDGQFFVGISPSQLEEGDAFTVRNRLGWTARLEAAAPRTEALIASGFTAAAVPVLAVGGNITGPGVEGAILEDVVASGPHNLLRLRANLRMTSAAGSFTQQLVIAAKGP